MNSSSSMLCREVFDENSQPSADEINEYAKEIGIDPGSESHLLPIAKDGLMHALPPPWKVCYDEKVKGHYYYNPETKASQWDHPVDQIYKNIVVKARTASERGDSVLDDTCASVQELATYEETSKYVIDKADSRDRGGESQMEDFTLDSSMDDDPSAALKNYSTPLTAISVKKAFGASHKYNLAPLSKKTGALGFSEKKLGDIKNTLSKKTGDSSLLGKPLLASQFSRRHRDVEDYSDDEFISDHSDSKVKPLNGGKKMIDLSMIPLRREVDGSIFNKPQPKLERGLTLTGGGSIFLKSNRNAAAEKAKTDLTLFLESNNPKTSTKSTPVQSPSTEQPKGILRERSYDSSKRTLSVEKLNSDSFDKDGGEDDKKSVRFNLEKNDDIRIEFSLSPSSNSSSDVGQEKHSSIISNIASDTNADSRLGKVEAFCNPTSSPIFSEPLAKNPFKPGKLTPISRGGTEPPKLSEEIQKSRKAKEVDWENVKKSVIGDNTTEKDVSSIEESRTNGKSENNSSAPIKKLIKPNPNDFIRPSLFKKSFDRISDMIKPINIDSDSDNEVAPSPRSPPYPHRNKISIKLMESIDSEASLDSPDRDADDIEAKFLEARARDLKNDSQMKDFDLSKAKTNLERDMQKSLEDYRNELRIRNEDEKKRIKEEKDREMNDLKQSLDKEYEKDKIQLKQKLDVMAADYKVTLEKAMEDAQNNHEINLERAVDSLNDRLSEELENTLAQLKGDSREKLDFASSEINRQHEENIAKLQEEKQNALNALQSQLENGNAKAIAEIHDLQSIILEEEKARLNSQNVDILDKLKQEHEELCNEIRKDYRTEVDLLRSQHTYHLSQLREKLETERRRARDSSDEPSYDRLKTDKRLLEDKYKCLKEKYARLKSDVKLSIERRNKRREQSLTTGSETERSNSNRNDKSADVPDISKKDAVLFNDAKCATNSNNNSLPSPVVKLKNQEAYTQGSPKRTKIIIENNAADDPGTPPHSQPKINTSYLTASMVNDSLSDRSADNSRCKSPNVRSRSPLSNFLSKDASKHRNSVDDSSIGINDTSQSQSDRQPQVKAGRVPKPSVAFKADVERRRMIDSKNDGAKRKSTIDRNHFERAATDYHDSSDNANSSDYQKSKDSVSSRGKRKSFTRHKSASTSRLNYSPKHDDRPCSPVENLRQQLRKLEDLEDQFPDLTLQVDTSAYRLRYPFADFVDTGTGATGARTAELEFVAHRALVERERVRRARSSLRRRKAALRERQGNLRQVEKDQRSLQEEHDLTDMEISLHRTRSLLGEKVIRLRHIEKILHRMTETSDDGSPDHADNRKSAEAKQIDENKDTTLSDISSHSSGFSSTEGHSDLHDRRTMSTMPHSNAAIYEQSNEIMTSLENLNTEIRDIWNVLNNQQQLGNPKVLPPGQLVYTDLGWPVPLTAVTAIPTAVQAASLPTGPPAVNVPVQSIPTLADRLHAYRQMVANPRTTAATVVSQAQTNGGVATSLVERTKDLRDWLKQQASL